mmetsp:Transcript_47478/g.101551  ORF Transcript_47478/g.101551 Transcript_47478/m.101551 type:complete len:511 (+) Transcript_47478:56-1588(+)
MVSVGSALLPPAGLVDVESTVSSEADVLVSPQLLNEAAPVTQTDSPPAALAPSGSMRTLRRCVIAGCTGTGLLALCAAAAALTGSWEEDFEQASARSLQDAAASSSSAALDGDVDGGAGGGNAAAASAVAAVASSASYAASSSSSSSHLPPSPDAEAEHTRRLAVNVQNVGINCMRAVPGDQCHTAIEWTRTIGIKTHPEWYPNWLKEDSSFEDFQAALHADPYALCPHPCVTTGFDSFFANITLQPSVGFASSGRVVSQGLWCSAPEPAVGWSLEGCTADAARVDVKVLTYNLFWWNLFRLRGGNGGSAGHLIASANPLDSKFDVMGFQECEGITQLMEDGGLVDEYGALVGPHAMCIAFRKTAWDLIDDGAQDVAEDRHDQWYGTRAVMWSRLRNKATGRFLFFINHHGPLPVQTGGRCGGEAVAYNVLKVIANQARPGDGVILVGDFNSGPASLTLQSFAGRLDTAYTGVAFGGVDNVLTGCATRLAARNLGSGGSDHDALEVLLRL